MKLFWVKQLSNGHYCNSLRLKWYFNIFRDVARSRRGAEHLIDDGKESEGVVGVLRLPSHHPGQAESRSLCCNPGGLFVHCLCGECSFVWLLVTLAKCWLRSKPQTRPSAWNPKKGTPMSTYQPGEDLVRFPNLLADWNGFFSSQAVAPSSEDIAFDKLS